jgi:hypothetical protein
MLENSVSRASQLSYPTVVFLALLLSWNIIGQAKGNADFGFQKLHQPHPVKPNSPVLACSVENSDKSEKSELQTCDSSFANTLPK